MTTELTIVEDIREVTTFDTEKVNDYLKRLRDHETSIIGDISTEESRKEIASRAYKIAKAKTAISKEANRLKEEAEAKVKAVRKERDRIEAEMQAIQDEVRSPLTQWEQANEARVAGLQAAIDRIVASVQFEGLPTTADIKTRLDSLSDVPADWQEFKIRADIEIKKATEILTARWETSKKYDAEQIELAALRAAQIAREQKAHDDRIAAEAADKARKDAEEKARIEAQQAADRAAAEQARIEAEKQEAIDRANKAEADRIVASALAETIRIATEKKAADDLLAAKVKADSDRIYAESEAIRREKEAADKVIRDIALSKAKEDRERQERENDLAHRKKINDEVLAAVLEEMNVGQVDDLGNMDDVAKKVVTAIAKGKIPHVTLEY